MSHFYYFGLGIFVGAMLAMMLMPGPGPSLSDTIIWFYMPGCGHCTKMEGEWTKFCSQLPKHIRVKKIDITDPKNQKITMKYNVQGVPYIIRLCSNGSFSVYQGDRTAASLLLFATSN